MDQAAASGAPIVITLGKTRRVFRRLTQRDFGTLAGMMPDIKDSQRMFVSNFDVHRWASAGREGASFTLAIASLPIDYTPDQLQQRIAELETGKGWGSMVQRGQAAGVITGESMIGGDEVDEAEAEGGDTKPDPTTAGT